MAGNSQWNGRSIGLAAAALCLLSGATSQWGGGGEAPAPPGDECFEYCYTTGDLCEFPGGQSSVAPCVGLLSCSGIPRHARAGEAGFKTLNGLAEPSECSLFPAADYPAHLWRFAPCGSFQNGYVQVSGCEITQGQTQLTGCCFLQELAWHDWIILTPPGPGTSYMQPALGFCDGPSPLRVPCPPYEH